MLPRHRNASPSLFAPARRPLSPMTNQPLRDTALMPNLTLKSAIAEWRDRQKALGV